MNVVRHIVNGRRNIFHRTLQKYVFFSSSDDGIDSGNAAVVDETTTWIRPDRELSGDKGQAHLYKRALQLEAKENEIEEALFTISDDDSEEDVLKKLEEILALEERLEEQMQKEHEDVEEPLDWLHTRRTALGEQQEMSDIVEVKEHTLLDENEIMQLLEFFGGKDTTLLRDEDSRLGGAMGMILCTASGSFEVRTITQGLIFHLKERKLHDAGVLGARMGSNSVQKSDSDWNVVDCQNYIVHILDEPTRVALDLEGLWSGDDPLWSLRLDDENAIDEYVASHPVPPEYGASAPSLFDTDMSRLQRSRFVLPHRPVVPSSTKREDRKMGKERQRRQFGVKSDLQIRS